MVPTPTPPPSLVEELVSALKAARDQLRRDYHRQGLSFEPSASPVAARIEAVLKWAKDEAGL